MVPRGRLDLSAADFAFAMAACCRRHNTEALTASLAARFPGWHVLPALSVRTAWDALLAELALPAGSEVLVSDVTIPDMIRIVREHGLTPVPLPIDFDTLSVAPDQFERRITARSRLALIAHLFGSRMDIGPLAAIARKSGILLIEDAAQSFAGCGLATASPADVQLLSFGPIKTCTALGGGLALIRDSQLAGGARQRLGSYPPQTAAAYLRRTAQFAGVQTLASRRVLPYVQRLMMLARSDLDQVLHRGTRGFSPANYWKQLQRQPSGALLAMLCRRIGNFDNSAILRRSSRAVRLWELLTDVCRPGTLAREHTHWVLPIAVDDPVRFTHALRQLGFDATQRGSTLSQITGGEGPGDGRWERLVYLPNSLSMRPEQLACAVRAVLADG
jgi:perosamine synthetase